MLHLLTLVLFRIKLVCVAIVSCGTVNVAWLLEHTCRGPTLKRRSGTCPPSRHAKLSHSTKRWKRFLRTSARTSVNAAEQSSARVVSACPSKCKIHNPIWITKKCAHIPYVLHAHMSTESRTTDKQNNTWMYLLSRARTPRIKHLSWALWVHHCTCRGREFGGEFEGNSREFDGGFGEFDGFGKCVEL